MQSGAGEGWGRRWLDATAPSASLVQFRARAHLQHVVSWFQGDLAAVAFVHCRCSQQPSPQGCLPRKETTSTQKLGLPTRYIYG